MSMPSFPPNGADMTQEEALTMIIASIAMEELALSHILNAEDFARHKPLCLSP